MPRVKTTPHRRGVPKRGRYNLQYSEADLKKAMEMVLTKRMTYREAEQQFGIKKSTLRDKVSKAHPLPSGRPSLFTPEEELEILSWVDKMAALGLPQGT